MKRYIVFLKKKVLCDRVSYFKQVTSYIGGCCKVAASWRRHERDVGRERKKLKRKKNYEVTNTFDKRDQIMHIQR